MRLLLLCGFLSSASLALGFAPAPLPRLRPHDPETARRQLEGAWIVEGHAVGGRVQGGPGPKWETVRIERGAWCQTCRVEGRQLRTTPYLIRLGPKDGSRIDMAYRSGDASLLYGIFRLDGDRLVVTHATSGPRPTSHTPRLTNGQVRWRLRRVRSSSAPPGCPRCCSA